MAPFTDGGAHRRSHQLVDHLHLLLSVRRRHRAGARPDAARHDPTAASRSTTYMRAMWREHGKPGGGREGYVDRPYTIGDAEATLAEVSGDAAFARDFFARYIQRPRGRRLRAPARGAPGFIVRKVNAGRAWLGDLRLESRGGARVASLVAPTWPIYAAGIDQDDGCSEIDGQRIAGRERRRRRAARARSRATRVGRVRRSRRRLADAPRHARRGSAPRGRAGRSTGGR